MGDRREGKRLFLGLLLAAGALLGGAGLGVWALPRWVEGVEEWVPAALGALFGVGALFVLAGIAILAFAILFERDLPGTRRLRGVLVRGFFPPLVWLARLVGIRKERVERSFVAVNNQLVLRSGRRAPPERVLILLPHCLQVDSCDIRITGDVAHCRRCGRCPIAGLVALGERYGVHLSVATGGTIARRIIVEQRPQVIVAVACERDLTSGIQDAHPLPVYGILNDRPHGPCFNTQVDLGRVERALERLVAGPAPRAARRRASGESL
ncbi:MAG: DUF116 domain-containing protein [Deferrisomatales bacterium]